MMTNSRCILITIFVILSFLTGSHLTFDDVTSDSTHSNGPPKKTEETGSMPKDKVLLRDVKVLTFQRNKRTTSRRTHPIHQLSCVGGTAGCRLFTPNVVECENAGFDDGKSKYNWRCHAELGDRVVFNHVEVICEGYDYPEDDYILLGSCGLEFTLDYADPHDYHDNSYFKHMDEHEKEMHHDRVRATAKPESSGDRGYGFKAILDPLFGSLTNTVVFIVALIVLALAFVVMVKLLTPNKKAVKLAGGKSTISQLSSSYSPFASAIMTTKKAC